MTCSEFHHELPDYIDEGGSAESQAHLEGCDDCAGLVDSLRAIVDGAKQLQATEEPSPRVWNSIEFILRQEKLIREPQPPARHSIVPWLRQSWGLAAWLVPAAAALLVGAGILLYQQRPARNVAATPAAKPAIVSSASADMSDEQLLQEVSVRAPMMRAAYESNLRDVNNYIRDAQDTVNANPNDEEAQQALMDAYGQKSMIYDMALERSLP